MISFDIFYSIVFTTKELDSVFLSTNSKAHDAMKGEKRQIKTLVRLCQRTTNDWWQWTASFEMSNHKAKHMQTNTDPYKYIRQLLFPCRRLMFSFRWMFIAALSTYPVGCHMQAIGFARKIFQPTNRVL